MSHDATVRSRARRWAAVSITAWARVPGWPPRRWVVALGAAAAFAVLVAIPTDLIPNPVFGREIAPTWWSWPALATSALLGGLLAATYVDSPDTGERGRRRGWAGGVLTFFAVGCPVCNKLVLVLLGSAGALTWFEPVQPVLQLAAVVLLLWALQVRLNGELACAVAAAPTPTPSLTTPLGGAPRA